MQKHICSSCCKLLQEKPRQYAFATHTTGRFPLSEPESLAHFEMTASGRFLPVENFRNVPAAAGRNCRSRLKWLATQAFRPNRVRSFGIQKQ